MAVGFPGVARATPTKREGVRWNTADGRFDSTFLTTSPASAAENTVQPSADVPALTLKSRTGILTPDLNSQEWQTSDGVVYAAISDIGASNLGSVARTLKHQFVKSRTTALSTALHIEKAAGASAGLDLYAGNPAVGQGGPNAAGASLRIFSQNSDRGHQNATFFINSEGAFYTHRWGVISGTTAGEGETWQIVHPSNDNSMLGIWCDTDGPALQIRDSPQAPAWPLDILDGLGNHVFSVESDGGLRWGISTRPAMDTALYRDSDNQGGWLSLRTDGHFRMANNAQFLMNLANGNAAGVLNLDSGNVLNITTNGSEIVRTQFFTPVRFFTADASAVLDIDPAAGGLILKAVNMTIANGNNIVLGMGTGTIIGTASDQKLGFFNATPVVQRPSHGPQTAGSGYGSRERNMLNDVYAGLRALGLLA